MTKSIAHIATVHWKTDKWVDIQLNYLNRHIKCEFRVYAFLNGIEHPDLSKFHYTDQRDITDHATKLNLLADKVIERSENENDLLVFIDGDAFPIADIIAYGKRTLKEYPLIAIQRSIEEGDLQPHPSFCMTTVGFWKKIKGDWQRGYKWKNKRGLNITDIGGNLLGQLVKRNVNWYPMTRSNTRNLHHLRYGIYGDIVYHHGAGFRPAVFRGTSAMKYPIRSRIQTLLIKASTPYVRRFLGDSIKNLFRLEVTEDKNSEHVSDLVYHCLKTDSNVIYNYFIDKTKK